MIELFEKDNQVIDTIENEADFLLFVGMECCGPCRMFKPMILDIAKEAEILCFYVNGGESPLFTSSQNILTVPYLLFYKGGECVKKGKLGADIQLSEVEELIEEIYKGSS
jgi:thiol-disulfide isomerase/thioredoxin